jgi:hypothetical protein
MTRMKLLVALCAFAFASSIIPKLGSFVAPPVPQGVVIEREELAKRFPLVDSKQDLFAADADYLLRPIFDATGAITEIRVVPKYYFEETHPEWPQPGSITYMPVATYEELLRRICEVKSLGSLIKQGQIGITLNLQASFWDQYEKGFVERAMFRMSPEEADGVSRFKVIYFHTIVGKLESKRIVTVFGLDKRYSIKVDGMMYWTTAREFQGLTKGMMVKVEAAGPP